MHQDDDDNYNDDHDYDNSQDNLESQYKKYFKFDPYAWDAWGKWLQDALNDIVESSPNVWYIGPTDKSFPVNSYFSDTGKDKTFQYLGSNYQGVPIWKKKYFGNQGRYFYYSFAAYSADTFPPIECADLEYERVENNENQGNAIIKNKKLKIFKMGIF